MRGIDDEVVLLWVARETGVLPALLSSADTPEEAAAEAGVSERAARILARGLADRGFFERVDGVYEPSNRSLGFLTRRDLRSVGTLPHRADLLARYLALPEGVETGDGDGPKPEHGDGSDGEDGVRADGEDGTGAPATPSPTPVPEYWTVNRLGAVAATDRATVRALVTATVREHPGAEDVIDVGGAPGVYAREFAERGYEAVLVDRPDAVGPTRPLLAREPVEVVAREYADEGTDLPAADLAFLPDVTRRLGPAANRRLFANVAAALSQGGTVVAVDHLRDRSDRGTAAALVSLATTTAGDVYPAERYREWLEDAGFVDGAVRPVPGTDRWAVVGRIPE